MKREPSDGRARVPVGKLRLFPEVIDRLEARATEAKMSISYYLLYLIGKDLGYLPSRATRTEVVRWLKDPDPDVVVARSRMSKAGKALHKLGPGAHTTREIAERAGLNYQQAYRQLRRDKTVRRIGSDWTTRPKSN